MQNFFKEWSVSSLILDYLTVVSVTHQLYRVTQVAWSYCTISADQLNAQLAIEHITSYAPCGVMSMPEEPLGTPRREVEISLFVTWYVTTHPAFGTYFRMLKFVTDVSGRECNLTKFRIASRSPTSAFRYPNWLIFCGKKKPWTIYSEYNIHHLILQMINVLKTLQIIFTYEVAYRCIRQLEFVKEIDLGHHTLDMMVNKGESDATYKWTVRVSDMEDGTSRHEIGVIGRGGFTMRQMRQAPRAPTTKGAPTKILTRFQKRIFLFRKKSLKVNLL